MSLSITVIQSDLHWQNKQANLDMFANKILSLNERTEVVVLPEMFTTGFSMEPEKFAETMEGPTVEWMKKITAEKRIILTGSLMIESNGDYYNRLVWMLPNGTYGFYDKRHLFAYAQEDLHFKQGDKRLIASVKGWKINLMVCYDLRFPVWARQQLMFKENASEPPEYDVLIYVANWPEKRNHAWKTLLQARAIENQCYVVGVNRVGTDGNGHYYSGDSMIVDPMGSVLHTTEHAEDIFKVELQRDLLVSIREKLPFLKDADSFLIQS